MLRVLTITSVFFLTYQANIKPILDSNCAECHHRGGREPNLDSFPFTMSGISDQVVIADKILQASGGRMPPSPRTKLSDTERSTIEQWKNQGLEP